VLSVVGGVREFRRRAWDLEGEAEKKAADAAKSRGPP